MNTNVFLGKNTGRCNFSHFGTLRIYGNVGTQKYETYINDFFYSIPDFKQMAYSVEKNKHSQYQHLHTLWSFSDNSNGIESILKYLNTNRLETSIEKRLVKVVDEVSLNAKDTYFNVNSTDIYTRKVKLHIEQVIGNTNAAIYLYKQCSYGLNSGYFQR